MRIIAGSKRGMSLFSPETEVSRPILDRVKGSLFSVLYNYGLPQDKRVADLFCGVGSLGLEAISRGAVSVTFIEKDQRILTILKRNIEKAGFGKQSKVIRADVFKVGAAASADEQIYDIIFVDPPYPLTKDAGAGSLLGGLLVLLDMRLAAKGIVIVRTEEHTRLLERYGKLSIIEQRKWGTMTITILGRKKDDQ
jgi:16S rRNA (guanine966-N2)-methyltransferase